MDPRQNPYAPGAGTPPPELAGRDALIERAAVALDRVRAGRSARSFVFYGLRGVGKTVLLNRIRRDAEARGIACVRAEASEERSLPALLLPALRAALLRLSRGEALRDNVLRGMRALAAGPHAPAWRGRRQPCPFSTVRRSMSSSVSRSMSSCNWFCSASQPLGGWAAEAKAEAISA